MIELAHITKCYGGRAVLEDVSLRLEAGITCLMGPSGAGKTTLLRILLGLTAPDAGAVTGIAPGEAAVMFQEDRLLPWLSVRENVSKLTPCANPDGLLRSLGLDPEAEVGTLSGGMARRVALARALCYPSKLRVLDEPFQGMDVALKQRLYPLLRRAAEDKPVLFVSHDPDEAKALADRIIHL